MILDEIAEKTQERIEEEKKRISEEQIRETALNMDSGKGRILERMFEKEDISFICEVKKASPSKGIIAPDFPYVEIAKEYEAAGASAVSVLTEPYFFQGQDKYLTEIAENVSVPVLHKDFILDPYQIYHAKMIGASAIVLISGLLSLPRLKMFTAIAQRLGMSAVVEAHTEEEMKRALGCGAEIVGVSNRNLETFETDITVSIELGKLVPDKKFFVSAGGIRNAEDIQKLQASGVDAVVVGEAVMCSPDKRATLDLLRSGLEENRRKECR